MVISSEIILSQKNSEIYNKSYKNIKTNYFSYIYIYIIITLYINKIKTKTSEITSLSIVLIVFQISQKS